jgi:hypothetical protein
MLIMSFWTGDDLKSVAVSNYSFFFELKTNATVVMSHLTYKKVIVLMI